MKKPIRPTMRDLAAHLGLYSSTVSRALRNDSRITEDVRQQVQKAAQKLGYKRDAKLGELMLHLRLTKHRGYQGTLAWITNLAPADAHMKALIDQFSPHAEKRASQLGYKLE